MPIAGDTECRQRGGRLREGVAGIARDVFPVMGCYLGGRHHDALGFEMLAILRGTRY
jgi:hypothetical protein